MKNPINHSVFIVIDGVSASVVNYFAEHNITGCVLRYNKQGLCVPQKSPSQPKSADSLGAQPPIPRERRSDAMGKDIRIAVRVTAKEKGKIQSKARKCGLSTTEYVKQRALGLSLIHI